MHRARTDRKHTPEEFAALVDGARTGAARARREALIGFWNEVYVRTRRTGARLLESPGAVFDRPVDPSWPHAIR